MIEIMGVLQTVMDRHGIRWWADYGTLLGAVRNPLTRWSDFPWLPQEGRADQTIAPGIVPHDKDGDLGALGEDWVKFRTLRNEIERAHLMCNINWTRGSAKICLSRTNHTNVDVFFWYQKRRSDRMYRKGYAAVDRFKGKEFSVTELMPFSTVQWEGLTLPAPRDPEAFLAMRYGPNWRTPVKANNDGVVR